MSFSYVSIKLNATDLGVINFYCRKYKITQPIFLASCLELLKQAIEQKQIEEIIGYPNSQIEEGVKKFRTKYSKRISFLVPKWRGDWKEIPLNKNYLLSLLFCLIDPISSHPRHILRILSQLEQIILWTKDNQSLKAVRLVIDRSTSAKRRCSSLGCFYGNLVKAYEKKKKKARTREVPGTGANLKYHTWEI